MVKSRILANVDRICFATTKTQVSSCTQEILPNKHNTTSIAHLTLKSNLVSNAF